MITFHTWGEVQGYLEESCTHSLLYIQKVIQTILIKLANYDNSETSTSLYNLSELLNTRWKVEDVNAVVFTQHQKKRSETGWTNTHAQPFRHQQTTSILVQKQK